MRIGFTSQNYRTITGHAGRTRRFLVYELGPDGQATEQERLDLPEDMTLHAFHRDGPHPLDALDVLVTRECGTDFITRMARRGVTVVLSPAEPDPASVLKGIAAGTVSIDPPVPGADHHPHPHRHDHDHDCGRGHGHGHGHGNGDRRRPAPAH